MRIVSTMLGLFLLSQVNAEMVGPNQIPSDRVINNLAARLAKNPRDAEAEYLLGRTYYELYCSKDPRAIAFYGTEASPQFPNAHTSPWEFKQLVRTRKDQKAIGYAKSAIKHLLAATKIGGGEPGLYQLTLACAYEAAFPLAPQVDPRATGASFKKLSLAAYVASFKQSASIDRKKPTAQMMMTYESWISIEAADGVMRLDPKSPLEPEIKAHRLFMSKLPSGPITPLIFSLAGPSSLENLLDPTRIVSFNLDGTGAPQRYAWVKPNTAFLVWQPVKGTPICSGRQLFGSATWWLLPSNAYAAMTLIDDNADGWLSGTELKSLAVWQDKNQNGIAEPREVVSVNEVGISGLKASFTSKLGESYVSQGGLRMSDGRILPTYDWVTRTQPAISELPTRK